MESSCIAQGDDSLCCLSFCCYLILKNWLLLVKNVSFKKSILLRCNICMINGTHLRYIIWYILTDIYTWKPHHNQNMELFYHFPIFPHVSFSVHYSLCPGIRQPLICVFCHYRLVCISKTVYKYNHTVSTFLCLAS